MVRESILLSELGGHSFQPYSNREWIWFEHRLKHDWKGPSYAMRSIKNLETCRDDKKRALSCVTLKKSAKIREERLLLSPVSSFRDRRRPARVRREETQSGKILRKGEKHLILFARTSGSEKHSEQAPRSFISLAERLHQSQRTQKQSLNT